jgi:hypothetical protein
MLVGLGTPGGGSASTRFQRPRISSMLAAAAVVVAAGVESMSAVVEFGALAVVVGSVSVVVVEFGAVAVVVGSAESGDDVDGGTVEAWLEAGVLRSRVSTESGALPA